MDTRKSPIYELGSLVLCVDTFIALNIHAALDGMFILCCFNLSDHIKVLQYMFKEGPFDFEKNNLGHLRYLIKYHKSIISAEDDLNHTFKEVILVTNEIKLVVFVMARAQRPLEITSFIFTASMENYLKVRFMEIMTI